MTSLAKLLKYQKQLQINSTLAERRFVGKLRKHGFRVKTQVIVAPFIVDILIARKMLIIEVDGSIHDRDVVRRRDARRTEYLTRAGFTVLRVRNSEVGSKSAIERVSSFPDVIGKRSKGCAQLLGALMAKRNFPGATVKGRLVKTQFIPLERINDGESKRVFGRINEVSL